MTEPRTSKRVIRTWGRFLGDTGLPAVLRVCVWLWVVAIVTFVVWILLTALKPTTEIFDKPFGLPSRIAWENFTSAWQVSDFAGVTMNSVVITSCSVALIMVLSTPAAYVLSRSKRRSAGPLTVYFAVGMSIPFQVVLTPLLVLNQWLTDFMVNYVTGFWDARLTLVLYYVALSLPFTVFVLTGFFRSLPVELEEAAALDGASPARSFLTIMLPLARPGLVTVALLNVIGLWNEALLVLVFVPDQAQRTLPAALVDLYNSMQYTGDWGGLFAGVVIVVFPMIALYMWAGRRIIQGMTVGIGK